MKMKAKRFKQEPPARTPEVRSKERIHGDRLFRFYEAFITWDVFVKPAATGLKVFIDGDHSGLMFTLSVEQINANGIESMESLERFCRTFVRHKFNWRDQQ